MPIVTTAGLTALSGAVVTGTAVSGQVPVASSSTAAAWGYPPGFEIGYTQITAPVNIASTTEATGTTIISPGALTFDGTAVMCHFFAPYVKADTASAGDFVTICLFEGATEIGRLGSSLSVITANQTFFSMSLFLRFTPTAAAHTYTVTAFSTSTTGTPQVGAGAGGTGAYNPAFVRFTKV